MSTQTATSEDRSKVESFKVWLEGKPYWEQFLWQLHIEKDVLDERDLEMCYQFLLEDSGVIEKEPNRSTITFPVFDLDDADAPTTKSTLDKIENLRDVNAIDDGCIISFGKNLSIIYGDNGAGKSGVGRLLSNACLSRMPRQLLPNARMASRIDPIPAADFHISDATGSKVIKYKLGQVHQTLKSFSVFDHECALIHLNSENKVEFVPSKIKMFDEVFKSITNIEALLQRDADAKRQDNPTEGLFTRTSSVTTFLDSISHETTDRAIEDALRITPTDKTLITEKKKDLTKKIKQDIATQKKLLQDECTDLDAFQKLLATKKTVLNKARETQINDLLKKIRDMERITVNLSAKSFEFAAFKNVGTSEWKSLIIAAQKFHEMETVSGWGYEPAHCVLCRQVLTDKEKSLFGNYWKFLKSTVETELATARHTLTNYSDNLRLADTGWPSFSTTEVAVKILSKDTSADLEKIKTSFDDLKTQLNDWINRIKNEQDVTCVDAKINIDPIATLIDKKKKAEEKLVDPGDKIRILTGEIGYLEQKEQASRIIAKIKKYVAWLRWVNAARSINLPASRGNTTRKKTEIMGELVISQYVDIFNKETEKLDCNFGLKVESHGRDANTIKGLKLEFARGYSPSDILSEGEQTVSALADFLTEAKLDKNNSGIIFDDPVNSLDHLRRATIAKRLVEEAKERQVIVLTHDIVFMLDLQSYADTESVDHSSVSMRRIDDKVGLIKPDLPWIALNVGKKVGYLKNELAGLQKAESGDPDIYRDKVKLWYMHLREAWERAVEERLFKGVVQRFNRAVMTLKLAKVKVTPELIKEITDGMSESSKWLHDMAAGVNPTVPKNAKLATELASLEGFIAKCKAD